ncbi:EIIBC-MurNAc [Cedecea neteri]|uniref:EIIBC-MurNAc n=1 Tax=Cedecea neteri TaxID=158822 RepID=A0A2X2TAK0_9ENTR|nr:EIIBC-MurNAc [Cedecea neteri]
MGVVNGDDQLQIILGPGKAQTASELMNSMLKQGGQSESENGDSADLAALASQNKKQMKAKQNSAVHNFLTKFATIFTPLIPGFIAAGLLLGIATLLQQTLVVEGTTPAVWLTQLIAYMKVFSIGLFTFLSILIGFNTQKAFGGTGVNGGHHRLAVYSALRAGRQSRLLRGDGYLLWADNRPRVATSLACCWHVFWVRGSNARCGG